MPRAIIAVLCTVLIGACTQALLESPDSYIVQPQDTLYSIAWRFDLDFRELARWNGIGADFRIAPGQRLSLRPGAVPVAKNPAPRSASRPAPAPVGGGPAAAGPPDGNAPLALPVAPAPPPAPPPAARAPAAAGATGAWLWPTDRAAGLRPVPGGGILLFGRLGQDVRAAAAGRVVYTGSGLRSYGQLVIIRHGESLLSAYAHNRELLVHEGQEVARGELIARMGDAGHQTAALYFEIRLNGRPVDPLRYLPGKK